MSSMISSKAFSRDISALKGSDIIVCCALCGNRGIRTDLISRPDLHVLSISLQHLQLAKLSYLHQLLILVDQAQLQLWHVLAVRELSYRAIPIRNWVVPICLRQGFHNLVNVLAVCL